MKRIIYISGGQRSGKSSYAERLAKSLSHSPTYLATARCYDDEMRARIQKHQKSRGSEWTNIEEDKNISHRSLEGEVVLMDCVTLWLTNVFMDNNCNRETSLAFAKREWDRFTAQAFTLIVVSNEIGMGVVPMGAETRAFVDLQGWMNQYIAEHADEAYFMVSGMALKLK